MDREIKSMKLATAAQMRELDNRAINEYHIPGIILMENAGLQVVAAVYELLEDTPDANVVVFCGKGNNGGDGLVIARHLHNKHVPVTALLLAAGEDLKGDAATNYTMARECGVEVIEQPDEVEIWAQAASAEIIIDAILGTGITGVVHGLARTAIEAINASFAPVVAVDIPSGLNADTGEAPGIAVEADLTVTFALAKIGQIQYPGREFCGELRVADISFPREMIVEADLKANVITETLAHNSLPPRHTTMHKGDAGRVLVIAGSRGMSGAAMLCASAAVRAGAGLVTLASLDEVCGAATALCPEVMSLRLGSTTSGNLSIDSLELILDFVKNCQAVAIGPGLGQASETVRLVQELVVQLPTLMVLDADGLNCLHGDISLLRHRTAPTIITPHPGELARLLNSDIASIEADRISSARIAAQQANAVVVLKGACTVVADSTGEVWLNTTGNDGMASGGMGDVLTGMTAAFYAGGAKLGAVAAVYYHGLAADVAAQKGMRGLTASDVIANLPGVLG